MDISKTYKSVIKNGKVIERKQITTDYYRERDFIYKVGPEELETINSEIEESLIEEPIGDEQG